MSLSVIFDVKGVCNKLSAKKLPHSLSAPCAKLGWATVLLFLAFPPQAKLTFVRDLAHVPSQKPLSLLPPTPVWQPSWWEVSEEAAHPRRQLPGSAWGQPPAQTWSSLSWWSPSGSGHGCRHSRAVPGWDPALCGLAFPARAVSWYHGHHFFPWSLGHPPQLGLGHILSVGLPSEADHGFQYWFSLKLLSPNLFIALRLKWNLFFLFLI